MSTQLDIDDVCAGHPVAIAELERLRERIAALHAALRTYGWHLPECDYMQESLPCSCGFMDAVKEQGAMSAQLDIDDVCAGHPVAIAELERLRELEGLNAERNRQNALAFQERDRLREALTEARQLLELSLPSGLCAKPSEWWMRQRAWLAGKEPS